MAMLLRTINVLSLANEESVADVATRMHKNHTAALKLMSVPGVGPIMALSFVLTPGSLERFRDSRNVGACLGMTPKRRQSGERDPQLGISKAGDGRLRKLLVQCAHHILGHFGKDSALRRWGLTPATRGGPNASKRAIVAVVRKRSVILHKLWRAREDCLPFPA